MDLIDKATLPYRACAGIVLFNSAGKVFVGERIDTPGAWQFPQGGIDDGESVEVAAFRELKEEVGTDQAEIIRIAEQTICYDLPDTLIQSLWGAKYRGQEQSWVAMHFTGTDKDINLNSFDPPEFSAWEWVVLEEAVERIVPFKRAVYQQVIALFADISLTHP